ncbi:MAG: RNA polymerase sporulation sigma factor SigK [Clostridia bacterium]|nr:RNA polymerase sporulation sigma factor SigK [Clostridia bacterium]MBR2927298.1 RNA polymerase sporulation sigma factor SigK [Clostridia bacterium]
MIFSLFSFVTKLLHLILGISTPQSFPPPLGAEEERKCFLLAEQGDEEARQKLILHNLRLVSHIVRKYYSTAQEPEDLVSIGTIGLIKAVDTFNIHNGARFATYAAKCIQNEILMHFRSRKKLANEISINETIDIDRDGNPLTYMDVICCEEDVTEEIDKKIMLGKMMRCMEGVLTPRERQILSMRYGFGHTKALTQREIATVLGISRSYVSRIEKAALEKLRASLDTPASNG